MNSKVSPLFSIVTVTYNCKSFIEKTIKSIINQNFPDVEYLIVDGGSTDGTLDVIKLYESHLSYFISEKDGGIFDAMNKGIKAAKGKFINFLNAGDEFVAFDTLLKVSDVIGRQDAGVIYGDKVMRLSDNRLYGIKARPFFEYGTTSMGINHQCVFVRTDLAKSRPFDTSYRVAADYDMIHYLYRRDVPFLYLDIPIAKVMPGGFSNKYWRLRSREEMMINKENSHSAFTDVKGRFMEQIKRLLTHLIPLSIRRRIYAKNSGLYLLKDSPTL